MEVCISAVIECDFKRKASIFLDRRNDVFLSDKIGGRKECSLYFLVDVVIARKILIKDQRKMEYIRTTATISNFVWANNRT